MENLKNRRAVGSERNRLTMEDIENTHMVGGGNMMFREIVFPLTYEQRFHMFRQIVWNYSCLYLKNEDYKRLSTPKYLAGGVASFWGLGFLGL